jgi:hypothetical protein
MGEFAIREALYTKIVLITGTMGTSNADGGGDICGTNLTRNEIMHKPRISAKQRAAGRPTSQTYLTPPSPPRVAVFFLMTCIMIAQSVCQALQRTNAGVLDAPLAYPHCRFLFLRLYARISGEGGG